MSVGVEAMQIRDLVFGPDRRVRFGPATLSVRRGEFCGLLGPNGSGKSTLIRTLVGVIPPRGGRIELGGQVLSDLGARERARLLAYVPQLTVPAPLAVFEAVLIGRAPHMGFRPAAPDLRAVERALERLGIAAWRERTLDRLSGGERQKVYLARALAQDTPFLFLDEPLSGLDVCHQIETCELLRTLCREENRAIVCADHNLSLMSRSADRVVVLQNGAVVATGEPCEVLNPSLLHSVYGVRGERCAKTGRILIDGLSL